MTIHNRGYTRWRHAVYLRRRTKKDFNEHYDFLECECHTSKRVQCFLADTPTKRSNKHERTYRDGNGWLDLTIGERRAQGVRKNINFFEEEGILHCGSKRKDTKKWCRGKVGQVHTYKRKLLYSFMDNHYRINACQNCGKQLWNTYNSEEKDNGEQEL